MFYSKEIFELRKKTSSDILEDEQKEGDEVESSSTFKKDGKSSYKEKNEQFLMDIKEREKLSNINEIKNRQMQTFAETSSEYYTMPAKHSALIYILIAIFSLFLLASVAVVLFFNLSQYRAISYDYDDMKPDFSQGTVFMLDRHAEISSDSLGRFLYYQNESGKDVVRKIVSVDNLENFEISLSTLEEGATPEIFDINSTMPVYGIVSQVFGDGMGIVVFLVANYGYVLIAFFFVLVVTMLVIRAISSKKASNKFMNRMDKERSNIEKRRKQLSESVAQMESGEVDNIEVLSDLLNVSSAIPGEERLIKIQKQLQDRQIKQVEKIKKGSDEVQEESLEKKQENDVINFVRNEIEKQEQNSGLTEDEIAKRLKDAEDTNKNI